MENHPKGLNKQRKKYEKKRKVLLFFDVENRGRKLCKMIKKTDEKMIARATNRVLKG
jgi:5S rRNA maturation endonuclease (ribonuclease M5)